ncbi:DUF2796 domain-containing protein [Entomomonas asaccharolytica]|uniref:DUF2796 domain-containing protein n=1 Tax=Entomomonas asaccharolytica TaxID=2785331 RepID=A0A974NHE8_9GAMM|nr:DUF2796 domain-containing protein [Entomomonas asaccharolytica]QQP86432.1 DUF2796 domain-containing protein [Entomomonas asaccharolytica]
MRYILLLGCVCYSLVISTAMATKSSDEKYEGILTAHEHGRVQLNIAISDNRLEIGLDTAAINLVGFEHIPTTEHEKILASQVQLLLNNPSTLFAIPAAAKCSLMDKEITSPIFNIQTTNNIDQQHAHLDIDANYSFTCNNISALNQLDLSYFFKHFPNTNKITIQYIGDNGQKGIELTPAKPVFKLK